MIDDPLVYWWQTGPVNSLFRFYRKEKINWLKQSSFHLE